MLFRSIATGANAHVHVTTQSATIVHDCRRMPARLVTQASVARGGFLALLPDPLVLFPGADIAAETTLTLHEGGVALLSEAAGPHDPSSEERLFARLGAALTVRDPAGRVLLEDRGEIAGAALQGAAVLGRWRAWGVLLVLGPAPRMPDAAELEAAADALGCLAAATAAPAGLGLAVRMVGPDGGTLGRCLARLASMAALRVAGVSLMARGK